MRLYTRLEKIGEAIFYYGYYSFLIIMFCIMVYIIATTKKQKVEPEGLDVFDFLKPKKTKQFKHENKCRDIVENIFGVEFKSSRPMWLKNPLTNKNLELDMYNSTIRTRIGYGLAFEYDGKQHSVYTPIFHKSQADFLYQVKKDRFKDEMCKKMNVLLIRIPHYIHISDLESYITTRLKVEGLV